MRPGARLATSRAPIKGFWFGPYRPTQVQIYTMNEAHPPHNPLRGTPTPGSDFRVRSQIDISSGSGLWLVPRGFEALFEE